MLFSCEEFGVILFRVTGCVGKGGKTLSKNKIEKSSHSVYLGKLLDFLRCQSENVRCADESGMVR
jgi:hypothetical protein